MEEVSAILTHYGRRGMKWGVRRSPAELAGPQPVTIDAKPGKKIQTSGGKGQPVSDDAKLAAVYRQKAKASGPQSLSNAEMQTIVTRMNLEQQYMKLNPKQVSLGEKFLKDYAPMLALEGGKQYQSAKLAQDLLVDPKAVKDPRIQLAIQLGENLTKQAKKK
jgi:hypothetical protein